VGGKKLSSKSSPNQTETSLTNVAVISSSDADDPAFASLGASLVEIRKMKGVLGYIIRGNSSAAFDLAEGDKITQFAFLSYQLCESCLEIAKQLSVATIESALVEGKSLKVLFVNVGENKISVFMEKNIDHSGILKRVLI
jgi:predicted regulator of Ras-like GTPase activity (Roadblock/LC7/MglB family)